MSKKCISCDQILSEKAIKPACKQCRHKESCKKHAIKNKEKIKQYQAEYRSKNRVVCNQRSRLSYWKKPLEYNQKGKIHYREVHGIPLQSTFKKRKNGEGSIDAQGYKTITKRGHPNQMDEKGRIREHVLIMSEYIGRPLYKGESVHHKNGDRLDNRIENLELWSKAQPPGQRVKDKVNHCLEYLSLYGTITWTPFPLMVDALH